MSKKIIRNNSGGGWWLSDEAWFNLEKAGWGIEWKKDDTNEIGTLATSAKRFGLSKEEAVAEWAEITGQNPNEV